MKNPYSKPLYIGKEPDGIADIERGLEGGDNSIAVEDKDGVKANNLKGKPITNPKGISDNIKGLDRGDNLIAADYKDNDSAKNPKGKP